MIFFATLVIVIGFLFVQERQSGSAATYGFEQTNWSGGTTTTIVLHDNN